MKGRVGEDGKVREHDQRNPTKGNEMRRENDDDKKRTCRSSRNYIPDSNSIVGKKEEIFS